MLRTRVVAALLVVGLVGACDSTTSPTPSSVAVANPSASAAAPASAAPTPSPEPTPTSTPVPTATPDPTPTPSPTPTLAPTPAPTPVPWKTFTSKRYHYLIKYPPTWIVTAGTAGLADQFDEFGYPVVYISRDTVNGTISLNLTVSHAISFMKSHYKAKVISNSGITLAGWRGRHIRYSGVSNGVKVAMSQIIVARGSAVYFIEMFGRLEDAGADRALFKKIYTTWRPK